MTTYSSGISRPYVTRKSIVLPIIVMMTEIVDCPLVDCSLMLRMTCNAQGSVHNAIITICLYYFMNIIIVINY